MTTLEVICRRCGEAFTPDPGDYVRGLWRVCPACRSEDRKTAPPRDDSAPQRPNTPAAMHGTAEACSRRPGTLIHRHAGPPSSWWEWFRRWLDARRNRWQPLRGLEGAR